MTLANTMSSIKLLNVDIQNFYIAVKFVLHKFSQNISLNSN